MTRDSQSELPGGWTAATLHARADSARANAYAPYSGLSVGAALLAEDGSVFVAGNVENGSYGLTICAERSAVVQAVAAGSRRFAAIAIAANDERVKTLPCCGACLQVLAEFDDDDTLAVVFPDSGTLRVARLADLLPVQFKLQS